MSYATHAEIVQSTALRQRITGCVAVTVVNVDPPRWVNSNIWHLVVQEWLDAWAAAPEPAEGGKGSDESIITDDMILNGVNRIYSFESPRAWVQPTGAHDAYDKYWHVTHNNDLWMSSVADNVWEPGVSGWELVQETYV